MSSNVLRPRVMASETLLSYDQIPYNSGPFVLTHPSHLAVLPILFGLAPPPIRNGRVLELGCASGGNLIPMAQNYPEAEFMGIDLSQRQIHDGQAIIAELGLSNIELVHMSILDVDDSLGQFDYVLCHGVYSWVPQPVKEKILQIGAANLRPGGLCYVSYNTYPGWHLRGVVRDMMQYHTAPFTEPQTKIDQARLLLEFLNKTTTPRSEAYRRLLSDEAEIINRYSDSYLFHEHLEEVNEPCYFYQFVDEAAKAGLEYLAESDFGTMLTDSFDEETAAILRDAPLLRQEQYMDFLRNRVFRCSVLCHAGVKIDRSVEPSRLQRCHVSLHERLPIEGGEIANDSPEPLVVNVGHETIRAKQPLTKAALLALNDTWPAPLGFDELLAIVEERASAIGSRPASASSSRPLLAGDLMTLYTRGFLRAAVDPSPIATKPGDRPRATPFARLQARQGNCVTNQRHEQLRLTDVSRALLRELDGQRDRQDLLKWLGSAIGRGDFRVRRGEQPLESVDPQTVTQILDGTLASLAASGLLVA